MELKILKDDSHNNMKNKISSFTPYCGQDNIDQISMTCLKYILK